MASACAGMFVFGIVMAILGAILPSLLLKIQFDKSEAGNLFLFMNMAMLIMSVIFGPVIDRFGHKIFLIICTLLVAASLIIFASALTYSVLLMSALVLGFGGGGLNGAANALTSDLYPEKRSWALNVLGIFFGFGALAIPFLIGILLGSVGLSFILVLAGCFALVPLLLFSFFRFPPAKHGQGFPLGQAAKIIRHPHLWLCGFLLFFQSGNEFTVGGWVSTYLNEHFGMAPTAASLVLAGYWAAIMAGRLASSRIVQIVRNDRLVLMSAILSLAAALLLVSSPSGSLASVGAVLLGLGFAAIFPTTLAVVGESFPSFSGTAFSVIFMIALAGGMTSPWLAGQIAHAYGIKQGMYLPVANCSMIIILQVLFMKTKRIKTGMA